VAHIPGSRGLVKRYREDPQRRGEQFVRGWDQCTEAELRTIQKLDELAERPTYMTVKVLPSQAMTNRR
jgi:hypothetical protein